MSNENKTNDIDQPPIFDSWEKLYWLVLFIHACLIISFFFLTRYYE